MTVPTMMKLALAAVIVSGGCGLAGVRSTPSHPTAIGQTQSPSGALPPTAAPASVAPSTPAPHTPVGPTAPPATDPPRLTPPLGQLDGGDGPVAGWLGSFCWQRTCADVPAFPDRRDLQEVRFGTGDLEFTLAGGAQFVSWFASYGEDAGSLEALAQGGADFDPDAISSTAPAQLASATFTPPQDGDWLLTVQVFFTDGDATYAWRAVSQ